jgi:plasmid stabilization system protein ParE
MTRRVVLRQRAHNDLRSGFEWYERQRPGLGESFLLAVEERLENIAAFPDANRLIYRQVRRAVVERFPYLIFYVVKAERVDVLAVLHHARNPADWPSR